MWAYEGIPQPNNNSNDMLHVEVDRSFQKKLNTIVNIGKWLLHSTLIFYVSSL